MKSSGRAESFLASVRLALGDELLTPTVACGTHDYLLWLHHRNIAAMVVPMDNLELRRAGSYVLLGATRSTVRQLDRAML